MKKTRLSSITGISSLPKVDLHCHLEGAIRPRTVLDLHRKNNGRFQDVSLDDLLPDITATEKDKSLFDFLAKFETIMPALKTEDDLRRITREAAEDAHNDGVVYLELRFSPHFISDYCCLNPLDVPLAIIDAKRKAENDLPITLELILIIPQYGGTRVAEEAVSLATHLMEDGIRGIDIAGDIRQIELDVYEDEMERAAEAGLGITIHAGEVTPATTVITAVERLHATRIGHGIRAVEDPKTIDMLLDQNIHLEICLTSNLQTRAAGSIEQHPIHQLRQFGVWISLNTDDPAISCVTLSDEYKLAQTFLGMSDSELLSLDLQAMEAAFTSPERRQHVQSQIVGAE